MSNAPSPGRCRGSQFAAASLTTRRLRSNSGNVLYDDEAASLTAAETNSIVPPNPVYKIVLTGGPCGGKTTLLARLSPYLRERGFEVMTCPEAFTLLVMNGMQVGDYFASVDGMPIVVQDSVLDMQISLEDSLERVLRARGKPAVLLCDRGLLDGKAYMDEGGWQKLLEKRECACESHMREGRYNAVFHLVSAAEGAEEFYTLENNQARTETAQEARDMDHKTRNAWVGPNLKIFDNSTSFEKKLQRVVEETAKLVGLPTEMQRNTMKFLLKDRPDLRCFPDDVAYQVFDVEKVYLYEEKEGNKSNKVVEEYSFIRKRTTISSKGEESGSVYGWTAVQKTNDGQTIERKRIISRREYYSLFNNRDKSRHVVKQKRISFLWNIQSFTIHEYIQPVSDVTILHTQVKSSEAVGSDEQVSIPPFLEVEKKLATDSENDAQYGAYHLSKV